MKWQKIDTAPKDGSHVDLWLSVPASPMSFGISDAWRVTDCYWRDDRWLHHSNGKEKELCAEYITHWMPLPEPPASEDDAQ